MAVHMKDLLAREIAVNETLFLAMEPTVMLNIQVNPTVSPTSVVPRLGSCVATKGGAAVTYYQRLLTEFMGLAIPRAVDAPGRTADDGAKIQLLHLANALACAGVTNADAYPSLRAEIARPIANGFRPSDDYTLALAALATNHPDRAAIVARMPAPDHGRGGASFDVARFIETVAKGETGDALVRAYDDTLMMFVCDLGMDYPAEDFLMQPTGARYFNPCTMLWIARLRWTANDAAPLASVADRLRTDLRAYVGLK